MLFCAGIQVKIFFLVCFFRVLFGQNAGCILMETASNTRTNLVFFNAFAWISCVVQSSVLTQKKISSKFARLNPESAFELHVPISAETARRQTNVLRWYEYLEVLFWKLQPYCTSLHQYSHVFSPGLCRPAAASSEFCFHAVPTYNMMLMFPFKTTIPLRGQITWN